MKKSKLGVLATLALMVLVLAGCAQITGAGRSLGILPSPTPIPCGVQAQEFVTKVEGLLDDWDDANTLAGQTSRIALSPAIARLQEIRRDVHDLQPPECAGYTQSAFELYMDSVIEGYLLFMSDSPDSQVSEQLVKAQGLQDTAVRWFAELKAQQ